MTDRPEALEPGAAPPPSTTAPEPSSSAEAQDTVSAVLRACDAVLGATSISLALLGTWLLFLGEARLVTVAALWSLPVLNLAWSIATHGRDRLRCDLIRAVGCLPITTYIYLAESGVLEHLWIPSLVMAVGTSLVIGIATKRSIFGFVVTLGYAGVLIGAAAVRADHWDLGALEHGLGIVLTGFVISVVASTLGGTLEEARRQRDRARQQTERAEVALLHLTERTLERTAAIESLHREMEHRTLVEVELRQAQKLESVGRLAAGLAHEINTPVQFASDSIHFVSDASKDLIGVLEKLQLVRCAVSEGRASLDAASEAANAEEAADLPFLFENIPLALERSFAGLARVATIVRSMKEFAHLDGETQRPADLNEALKTTLTIARGEYQHLAEIETDLGEVPPVMCYLGELNQTFLNLLVNAAHAIAEVVGTGGDKGRIRLKTVRDGEHVRIEIADTGAGIPEAIRDRIFDPFFTTKEVGRGSGQGLAVARSVVVDKHGGRLTFESHVGKGTAFSIVLPIDGKVVTARHDVPEPRAGGHGAVAYA